MAYNTVLCGNCGKRKKGYKLDKNTSICLDCAEKITNEILRKEQALKTKNNI